MSHADELAEDYPEITCPRCGHTEEDMDGFGFVCCHRCGYCVHPSITDGVCGVCGDHCLD